MTPGQTTPTPSHPGSTPQPTPIQKPRLSLKVATTFAVASSLYFALSHYALSTSAFRKDTVLGLELVKDAIYVCSATLLLAAILRHFFNRNHEANQRLLENETRLNLALSAAHQGAWDWNLQSNQVFYSPEWTAMIGYEQHELSSSPDEWKSRVHPDDLPIALNRLDAHFKDHAQPYNLEHRIQSKDGSYRWILTQGEVTHRSPSGQPLRMSGTHTDIHQRKSAELALQERQRNLDAFFNTIDDLILVARPDGSLASWNRAVEQKLGYTRNELDHLKIIDLHPPELRDQAATIFAEMCQGQAQTCPLPLQRKDGSTLPVESRAWHGIWNGQPCIFGICKDLSAQTEASERFERLFRHNPLPMALNHPETLQFEDVNHAWLKLLGFQRHEVIGKTGHELNLMPDPQPLQDSADQLRTQGSMSNVAAPIRCRNGQTRYGLFSGEMIANAGQQSMLTVMVDVTDLRKAQQALKSEETQRQILIENSRDGIVILNEQGGVAEANPAFAQMLGYTPDEITELHVWDWDPDWSREKVLDTIQHLPSAGDHFQTRHQRKDGSILDIEISSSRSTINGHTFVFCICRDITAQKQAANALATERARLESIIESAQVGTWEWNVQTGETTFNERWANILGHTLAELQPVSIETWIRLAHPDDLQASNDLLQQHFEGKSDYYDHQARMRHKDGHWIWVADRGRIVSRTPDGKPLLMRGTHTDITRRKGFEAALQESEDRYRHLVEESPDAIGTYQNDSLTFINSTGIKLLGATSREQLIGRRAEELIHPDDLPKVKARIQKRQAGDKSVYPAEVRYQRLDGSHVEVEVIASPTHFDGQTGIQFIARDISERKNTEKAFREQKEIFTSVVTQASDSIVIIDETTGQFVEFNTAAHQDLGYSREEFATLQVKDFQADDSPDVIRQRIQQVSDHGPLSFESRHRHKDGSLRNVRVRLQHLNVPGRYLLAAVWTDITNQILLESQLRQSQKLEAVGQLAGGVAHDFNNILAAITMNLGMLKMKPGLDEELSQGLHDLSEEARRAANLTRQLLMFSRRSVLTTTPVNLNDVIDNLLKMLHRLIGEHIELIFDGKTNLHTTLGDVGMMEQIIVNLAVNARDAMPNGGIITLATANIDLTTAELEDHPDRRPGPFVRLSVTDTGKGIPPEIITKIFDPFFTTKELGKGSGLGLSTIHGIVAQHQGWIEVSSPPNQGATFSIYLPANPEITPDSQHTTPDTKPQHGTESILIVEDEPALRNAMAKSLRALGYQITTAPNAPEALELWNQQQHQFDLLVTDMVMPKGITGLQLAEELQQHKPSLKVIISSGYSAQISQAGIPNRQGIAYLPKPYEFPTLAHLIRTQLDTSTPPTRP